MIEAKSGEFAAGGLTESMTGIRRASTNDIIEAILEAGGRHPRRSNLMKAIESIESKMADPKVTKMINSGGANLLANDESLREIRGQLVKCSIASPRPTVTRFVRSWPDAAKDRSIATSSV